MGQSERKGIWGATWGDGKIDTNYTRREKCSHMTPNFWGVRVSERVYTAKHNKFIPSKGGGGWWTNLEMWAGDRFSYLSEEGNHYLLELGWIDDVEDFLNLPEEHNLLLRVGLGPELEQTFDHFLGETVVLLEELHYAVGQLKVR